MTHVLGHNGHPENEACDRMAVAAYKALMADRRRGLKREHGVELGLSRRSVADAGSTRLAMPMQARSPARVQLEARSAITVARASRARIMSGLSGVLAPGKLNIDGRDHRAAPLGLGRPEAFLPEGRAVLVIVAVAPLVEDHPPGGVEDEIGRTRRGRDRPCALAPAFLRSSLMVAKISPTASSPLETGSSGLALSESMPVASVSLTRPRIHRLPADGLEQGEPAGRVVAAGREDVMERVGGRGGVKGEDARAVHQAARTRPG